MFYIRRQIEKGREQTESPHIIGMQALCVTVDRQV